MQAEAGQQQFAAFAAEHRVAEPLGRHHEAVRQPHEVGQRLAPQQPQRRADRRERSQQRLQQWLADGQPLLVGAQPRRTVARSELVEGFGRPPRVPVEHGGPPIGQHVRCHLPGMAPLQTVRIEVEPAQHRRGRAERVERAVQVAGVPRCRHLGRSDRTADRVGALQHQGVPACVGEQVRGDQPVVAAANDHRVDRLGGHRPPFLAA